MVSLFTPAQAYFILHVEQSAPQQFSLLFVDHDFSHPWDGFAIRGYDPPLLRDPADAKTTGN